MAKAPTPTASSPLLTEAQQFEQGFKLRAGVARLQFLKQHDLGYIGFQLRQDPETGAGLTIKLRQDVEQAWIRFGWYESAAGGNYNRHEAEDLAFKEVIRPDSQLNGPILGPLEKQEILDRLAQWEKTPGAQKYLPA